MIDLTDVVSVAFIAGWVYPQQLSSILCLGKIMGENTLISWVS
jgi:hypothetical protein